MQPEGFTYEHQIMQVHRREAGTRHGEDAVNPSMGAWLPRPWGKHLAMTGAHSTTDSEVLLDFRNIESGTNQL